MSRQWRVVVLDDQQQVTSSWGYFHDKSTAERIQHRFAEEGAVVQHQELPTVHPWKTAGEDAEPMSTLDRADRVNHALARFVFPGWLVPRASMASAALAALDHGEDYAEYLPAKHIVRPVITGEMIERAAAALAERQEIWPVDLTTRATARAALVAALEGGEPA